MFLSKPVSLVGIFLLLAGSAGAEQFSPDSPSLTDVQVDATSSWTPVYLNELASISSLAPRLGKEILLEKRRAEKSNSTMHCVARRLGNSWVHLSGVFVSPYICQFGTRWL